MAIKIGLTKEQINTHYAPLAVIAFHYQENNLLKPLEKIQMPMKKREFGHVDKLIQVLVSQDARRYLR